MTEAPSLRQLRYFLHLAETGQYGRAAARAGISQPSLSLQIAELERRLRLKLVERRRRGVVLTPEGRAVRERAARIVEELEALVETAQLLETGMPGQLRLGSTPTIGPYLLPGLVRRLHAAYPEAKLVLRDGAPRELTEDLVAGRHDVILTQLPVAARDVTVLRLFREPLSVALAHEHPLAQAAEIRDEDLAGQEVLSLSSAYALHGQIATLCRDLGAHLSADYEGTSLDALRQMVAMNMGLTFLPALYVRSEISAPRGDVAVRPFRRGRFTRSIGLVWRASSGNAASLNRLAEVAREVIRADFAGVVIPEG
ncbi:hydrogen peroxide-inducible genes activator [Maliponia aquimaris]|uniref:Hydrogen peroxide-inducible genes activator n=1 Tax=Maliponia aquimaris TaxID=1673631 RepID=A0A238K196_9RHOB|nr:hydrogen peroxide-inducible genes activator [Maliponia aquimaris]SMX36691.1 Hydrogen peroxide-inducible genes activator [Maliponia aquimaris]